MWTYLLSVLSSLAVRLYWIILCYNIRYWQVFRNLLESEGYSEWRAITRVCMVTHYIPDPTWYLRDPSRFELVFGFIFSGVWTQFRITCNAQTEHILQVPIEDTISFWTHSKPWNWWFSGAWVYQSLRRSTCNNPNLKNWQWQFMPSVDIELLQCK